MQITLPEPHEGQQKVLNSTAKVRILMCGRQWGKSLICQVISIQGMFNKENIAYVTPTNSLGKEFYRQVLKILIDVPQNLVKTNGTDLRIELWNGGTLEFFSGEPEALEKSMRGRRFHKVIIDEAAKINDLENAWINVVLPTLLRHDGDALLVSTPRGKNYFYELYKLGLERIGDYESFNYSTHDNPYLTDKAKERIKNTMTPARYRQEILAIPTENEDNPFPADKILANTIPDLSKNETVVFGIDCGRKHDPTVIIGLDKEGSMTYFKSLPIGLPWPEQTVYIQDLPTHINKIIDSTGVGDPFVQFLEEVDVRQLRRFQFTSASKMRIMKQLILDVCNDQVKFIREVADELFTMEQREGLADRVKYEAQAGFHDDRVMALAMANFYRRQALGNTNFRLYGI